MWVSLLSHPVPFYPAFPLSRRRFLSRSCQGEPATLVPLPANVRPSFSRLRRRSRPRFPPPHAADSFPQYQRCFVFLPRPTGSIKTTKCCLSIRWYAHSWSTTLLRWHSPGGTGLPTLSRFPLCSAARVPVPSFSFQLHRRRLFFRPFIGGSPYSWAFASLPDNPRVKLLCPVGIALSRYLSTPFLVRVRGTSVCRAPLLTFGFSFH